MARKMWWAGGVAAVVLGWAVWPAVGATSEAAVVGPSGSPSQSASPDPLTDLSFAVRTDLGGRSDYAGQWVDRARSIVVVRIAGDAAAVTSARSTLAKDGHAAGVIVESAAVTEAYLLRLQARTTADLADLRSRGIELTGSGVDAATNRLVLTVRDLTEATTQELLHRYGDHVVVEAAKPRLATSTTY